jgi:hypothetical protein
MGGFLLLSIIMTQDERKIMKRAKVAVLVLAFTLISGPVYAGWSPDTSPSQTVSRMQAEDLLQTRADGYFVITVDDINSTPQVSGITDSPGPKAKYAVIVGGVVDRIVTWDGYSPNRIIDSYGIIVKLPAAAGVKYVDANGIVRLKPITQGSIVSVAIAPDVKVTPSYEILSEPVVSTYEEPTLPAVTETYSPVVTSQTLNSNNSVSMTVNVPNVADIPSTSSVSVYTVTDGRSTTAVGLLPGQQTVTINDLPQDQNVTVKTVIKDSVTNTEKVVSNTVVSTPVSNTPLPTPARDAAVDKATIPAPVVSSSTVDASGARSVAISIPAVTNFDPTKTWATVMVVDKKSGSTTAIGTDGTAQTLNVGSLGADRDYTIKVVVRDLATGQETVINGQDIVKN